VLASGRNVKLLIMAPRCIEHRRPSSEGDPAGRGGEVRQRRQWQGEKDIGAIARSYGHVYVAQVAKGAWTSQTLRALREAESYDGPALIIAYSMHAHGIDMAKA